MNTSNSVFDEHTVLHDLGHFLPAQNPLKDFIHHNTLHAFQHLKFFEGLKQANEVFGYKVLLDISEYRELYNVKRIRKDILQQKIMEKKGKENLDSWYKKLTHSNYPLTWSPRIGNLRASWKREYFIDLDLIVQPALFRTLCSYLDQGISIWNFPIPDLGLMASIRELERNSYVSFFKTQRARDLMLANESSITDLLKILVGDETLYSHYLFDQQFSHQGWSGMVASIEREPASLLDTKKVTLHDLVLFELLLEIDALDNKFGKVWAPLANVIKEKPLDLFAPIVQSELSEVLEIWQNAFEWTYYDQVLAGLQVKTTPSKTPESKSFQAFFCIDDRECSLRRYLENLDHNCETFGTPGFFGVEFFYRPEDGKFLTKLCPAPVTPKYLITEGGNTLKRGTEPHFTKYTHSLLGGMLVTQTLGFWAAARLALNIFRPSASTATVSSFKHMDKFSNLQIENKSLDDKFEGLQVGFTVEEMANRVEGVLRTTGLLQEFADLIYIIGHGSSSVNNPHYAAYDCGACCGRPGSVNARVFSFMANHLEVRKVLAGRGINIPASTQFLGGLHDTTRDEIVFYDESNLSPENSITHLKNNQIFRKALDLNAKERSRRFEAIDTKQSASKIHELIRRRSVSLFEPRPELNHATNALCIIGRRDVSKGLFLDRRSFMNSYDYRTDGNGTYLLNIMRPIGPVCGGINLEYFFSRMDNQKLGAGTKLPHNVMGLFGVANGTDGDLRPGLPSQMIEVHDPVRLLVIVEHYPEVVLSVISKEAATYEWFKNEWVHIAAIHPETKELFVFNDGIFSAYKPLTENVEFIQNVESVVELNQENCPVYCLIES